MNWFGSPSPSLLLGDLADEEGLAVEAQVPADRGAPGQQLLVERGLGGVADDGLEDLGLAAVGGLGEAEADIQSQDLHHAPRVVREVL
jgi:hypothetical protein